MGGTEFVLLFVLLSGGQDLLDAMPTEGYWKAQRVEITAAAMAKELDGELAAPAEAPKPDDEAAKVKALIEQLGARTFAEREAAQAALTEMGEKIRPAIEQAAKSEDPEVAVRAQKILTAITPVPAAGGVVMEMRIGPQHKAIRRLMAIRTLGELKCKEALPLLEKLTRSEAMFEAEYARRAIARIEGKDVPAVEPFDLKLRAADLAALPEDVGGIAQILTMPGTGMADIPVIFRPVERYYYDPAQSMIRGLHGPLEEMGNVRLQHATVFVPAEIGDDKQSYVGMILRGSYDKEAVAAMCKRQRHFTVADTDVYTDDREVTVAIVSDSVVVVFTYPHKEAKLPLESVIKGLKAGEAGGIEKNEAMQALLKTVDQKKDIYAVLLTNKVMQAVPVLAPVRQITLEVSRIDKGIDAVLKARGEDGEQVEQAGRLAQAGLQSLMMQGRRDAPPAAADMFKVMDQIKFTMAEGMVTVTLKAETEPAVRKVVELQLSGAR